MALLRAHTILLLGLVIVALVSYNLLAQLTSEHYSPPKADIIDSRSRNTSVPNPVVDATQILLVTAFFPTSDKLQEYKAWLALFLGPIKTHIYIYTPPSMVETVRELRGDLPITINSSFASPFDTAPLKDLRSEYEFMRAQDPHKHSHSSDLYAMWNSKPYFLDQAVRNMHLRGERFEYAFWNDAASFRDNQTQMEIGGEWPDVRRVEEIWRKGAELTGTLKEDLFFFPMRGMPNPSMRHWSEMMGPFDSSFTQGTFLGGAPKAISWFAHTFYAYHDYYLFKRKAFVGQDQRILNSLSLLFSERIITLWPHDPEAAGYTGSSEKPLGECGPPLYYYQYFFASDEDKDIIRYSWSSRITWPWSMFKGGRGCRRTQLLSMLSVLKRQFGLGWGSPHSGIDPDASYRS